MAWLAAARCMLGQEVQLDAGQFLTGHAVDRLPDELQLADGNRRQSAEMADDEELAQWQRVPRRRRRRRTVAVREGAVERVRSVVSTRGTGELSHTNKHTRRVSPIRKYVFPLITVNTNTN